MLSSADTVPHSPVPTSLEGPRGHRGSEMLPLKLEDCCKSQGYKGKIIQKQALIYVHCFSCLLKCSPGTLQNYPLQPGGALSSWHLESGGRACTFVVSQVEWSVVIILVLQGAKLKVAEITRKGTCSVLETHTASRIFDELLHMIPCVPRSLLQRLVGMQQHCPHLGLVRDAEVPGATQTHRDRICSFYKIPGGFIFESLQV